MNAPSMELGGNKYSKFLLYHPVGPVSHGAYEGMHTERMMRAIRVGIMWYCAIGYRRRGLRLVGGGKPKDKVDDNSTFMIWSAADAVQ